LKVLDIPLTVKMRTGISDKKVSWNAHKLITNLKLWDVSLVTVRKLKLIVIFLLAWEPLFFSIIIILILHVP